MNINPTLAEFFHINTSLDDMSRDQLGQIFNALAMAAKIVNSKVNCVGLLDLTGASGETNVQGETQQKLDVFANEVFKSALAVHGHVGGILSEEDDEFVDVSSSAGSSEFIVALDPIDGSSNIDSTVPVGTIFSIYRRKSQSSSPMALSDFLQPGRVQVGAGYIIYGSSTVFVYTLGEGVHGFTLDPLIGEFCLSHENLRYPVGGNIYSVNEGHYLSYPSGIKQYVDHCKTTNTLTGKPYSARYVGSLVVDFHRNLLNGGIYLYPPTSYNAQGKIRLIYECNPLAMLAEQAGGAATNGVHPVLDVVPESIHQRSPLFFGAKEHMQELAGFLVAD